MEKLQTKPVKVYIVNKRDFVAKSNGKQYYMINFQTLGSMFDVFVDKIVHDRIVCGKEYLFSSDVVTYNNKISLSEIMFKDI
ncbi:MAG: hypothetical protein P9L97_09350 [Candidatus Tenebribacter davisii]|nr:hypothetical protein [Candidatus Tenebribacter davisii]